MTKGAPAKRGDIPLFREDDDDVAFGEYGFGARAHLQIAFPAPDPQQGCG